MGNDWFHEYFINELKAIGRKNASKLSYEVVDSLPSSGNEQTIYFVKNDSSSSNNHYDEYVWISSSSTFEKIGSSQIDGSTTQPNWNQNDETQPDYVKNRPFYMGDPVETVVVEERTVAFEDFRGAYAAEFETTFVATVGETYKVYWDGTVYECTCTNFNNAMIIGNLSIIGQGADSGEPFIMGVINGEAIQIFTADTSASHTISISRTVTPVVKINEKYLPDSVATKTDVEEVAQTTANNAVMYTDSQNLTDAQKQQARTNIGAGTSSFSGNWNDLTGKPIKPAGESYLTFSSPNSFTLSVNSKTKPWDGTLEYFASDGTWTTWDGKSALSAIDYYSEYILCLRGIGNTCISGRLDLKWILTGADIKCIGNIENLLDYATVKSGAHPTLANNCYQYMFAYCTSLTQAPDLPATTLANYCYNNMFRDCTSLTQAPVLPATTLVPDCYSSMFQGCTSLTKVPALPATTLASNCYNSMFSDCTSLTQAPVLPATTLVPDCYSSMFQGCTSLTKVPALPATTLASNCYSSMFSDCTSLTQAPVLSATTLADYCCYYMFANCTSLTKVPALPATTLAIRCYTNMFEGCTGLKLSTTLTNEYTQEYRIPSSGDGTTASAALSNMFASTGGTFTGGPSINTTYYLSTDNMIVRETEIATLNGYVDSMIDTALSVIGVAEEGAY